MPAPIELASCATAPALTPPEHCGVWLDRCYPGRDEGDDKPLRRALHARAVDALKRGQPAVEAWRACYARWRRDLVMSERPHREVVVEATSRVLLHPASNASVTDGAVLLHHTWGVPYLPGSGLKGVARAWFESAAQGRDKSEVARALFGFVGSDGDASTAQSGVVDFHDALWIPDAAPGRPPDWSPLSVDVVNPHQTPYYTQSAPPTDWHAPTPTHRLTVSPGARFLVVLEGATAGSEAWLDHLAATVLPAALEHHGFGAWTRAGYGRFKVVGAAAPAPRVEEVATAWHEVTVTLDPGPGRLRAALSDGRVAEAINPRAGAMRATLPEGARQRLKDKKKLRVMVRVARNGNAWEIVEMKEAGG